jgi:hypothetical protein
VVLTVCTLAVLLGLLVSSNTELRQRTEQVVVNGQWDSVTGTLRGAVAAGSGLLFGYAGDHTYQFTYLVAAVVFFGLMLKVIR